MTFPDCMRSGGHYFKLTDIQDSMNREVLVCSKCYLPVYRDKQENIGLLSQDDALVFGELYEPPPRVVLTLVGVQ